MDTEGRVENRPELFRSLRTSGAFLPCKLDVVCCCWVTVIPPRIKRSRAHSMLGLRGATKISTYLNLALVNSLGQKGPSCPVLSSEWDHVCTICVRMQGLLLTCLWAVEGTDWILSDRNRMCSGSPLKNMCYCGYLRDYKKTLTSLSWLSPYH